MKDRRIMLMRRAVNRLAPSLDVASNLGEYCADVYLTNATVRAVTDATTALAGLILIDRLLGFPVALRLAYLAPIWLAAQRGGRRPGLILVLMTTAVITLIDLHRGQLVGQGLLLNGLLCLGVLYGLMRLIVRTESQLQTYASMATRDPLTGIGNRLAFEEYARQALDRSLLAAEPLSIVMVDCDKFKVLNDTYGHVYGDHILKTVAKLLRRGVQPNGFAARTGGDEFIVVLPGKTAQEASRILERIHSKFVENTDINGQPASFSFGASELGENGISVQSMLDAADKDMYLRKARRASTFAVIESVEVSLESA
jgi:diguanylate cyclase (GGDEF)-like protein